MWLFSSSSPESLTNFLSRLLNEIFIMGKCLRKNFSIIQGSFNYYSKQWCHQMLYYTSFKKFYTHSDINRLRALRRLILSWAWAWAGALSLPTRCECFGKNASNNIWAGARVWAWPWAYLWIRPYTTLSTGMSCMHVHLRLFNYT